MKRVQIEASVHRRKEDGEKLLWRKTWTRRQSFHRRRRPDWWRRSAWQARTSMSKSAWFHSFLTCSQRGQLSCWPYPSLMKTDLKPPHIGCLDVLYLPLKKVVLTLGTSWIICYCLFSKGGPRTLGPEICPKLFHVLIFTIPIKFNSMCKEYHYIF